LVEKFAYTYWITVIIGFLLTGFIALLLFLPGLSDDPKEICEDMETDMDLESCISLIITFRFLILVFCGLKNLIEVLITFN
jgi:hypothetical protein